jgi:hypothetical protein
VVILIGGRIEEGERSFQGNTSKREGSASPFVGEVLLFIRLEDAPVEGSSEDGSERQKTDSFRFGIRTSQVRSSQSQGQFPQSQNCRHIGKLPSL